MKHKAFSVNIVDEWVYDPLFDVMIHVDDLAYVTTFPDGTAQYQIVGHWRFVYGEPVALAEVA